MTERVVPKSITANRSLAEMKIEWSDEHVSVYSFNLLRAACPCASCRGGHENMRPEPDEAVFMIQLPDGPEVHLRNISKAGEYGISIEWEDGHAYGIYNWNYLRLLCPCEVCHPEEAA